MIIFLRFFYKTNFSKSIFTSVIKFKQRNFYRGIVCNTKSSRRHSTQFSDEEESRIRIAGED